jgi:hypothetical protein
LYTFKLNKKKVQDLVGILQHFYQSVFVLLMIS